MAVTAFDGREITYANTLDVVMENYLSLMLPDVEPATIANTLAKRKTIEAKITAFENFPKLKIYKSNWLNDFITGLANRLSITLNAAHEIDSKIQSSITLVRPNAFSSQMAHDKAELTECTNGKVDVAYIEGSHVTILENGNLLTFINNRYLAHKI